MNVDDPHGRLLARRRADPHAGVLARRRRTTSTWRPTTPAFRWRGHAVAPAARRRASTWPTPRRRRPRPARSASTTPTVAAGLVGRAAGARPVRAGRRRPALRRASSTTPTRPTASPQALTAAREARPEGRVIVVFGCGGDRDASQAARRWATAAAAWPTWRCVTSDNPRSEDPAAIIAAVLAGVPAGADAPARRARPPRRHRAWPSRPPPRRRRVIAGKGHETDADDRRPGPALRRPRRGPRAARGPAARQCAAA